MMGFAVDCNYVRNGDIGIALGSFPFMILLALLLAAMLVEQSGAQTKHHCCLKIPGCKLPGQGEDIRA